MREIILNPDPNRTASAEEITAGLGFTVGLLIENSRQKAVELKDRDEGTQQDVKRAIKKLIRKTDLLAEGFDKSADISILGRYQERLKNFTEAMGSAVAIAQNNAMLSDIIDRFGTGLQSGMETFGLLDEETKKRLVELDNPTAPEEQ